MEMAFLFGASVIVGVFIGAVGIGGVLLVPALVMFAHLSIHEAAATALFSFLFTGLVGGWLFHRRGSIDWRLAGPVCIGGFLMSFAGAMVGRAFHEATLTWIIAAVLLVLGLYVLIPFRIAHPARALPHRSRPGVWLAGIGAAAGFGAGLTGAGGPLFSVPLMLAAGFDPLATVATGQVVQIASSLSGSLGNLRGGTIRYGLGLAIAVAELVGTFAGVRIAHSARSRHLRMAAAALCIVSAIGMAIRAGRE